MFLVHGTYGPAVQYAGTDRDNVGEKSGYSRDRCYGIYGSDTGLADKHTRNDTVAKKHQIDYCHRKSTGQQHRSELILTKTVFHHVSNAPPFIILYIFHGAVPCPVL